jgi:MFS family permease
MRNLRDYAIITATYWAFTLSDGALRMLVLLHLHEQGFAPFSLALLFVLYEFFGMVTNLFGGWLGAKHGLKITLGSGLLLQVIACSLLGLSESNLTVAFVMGMQGLSGIAKDLTKMSSKSYIKMVVPESDQAGLLKWVAILTGSKNTLKGVGFFLGGFLLTTMGFGGACLAMAMVLAATWAASMIALPKASGKSRASVSVKNLIPRDKRLQWLSAARLFLFGSRDAWFVVGLPIFLSTSLGWSFEGVGGFLAFWIIGYGIVQASAPAFVTRSVDNSSQMPISAKQLGRWKLALLAPLLCIIGGLQTSIDPASVLISSLILFAIIFAINSSVHSYLVVAYASADTVALDVGFYYMSNAAGRLLGTVLSGALFGWAGQGITGLTACIIASIFMVFIGSGFCIPLKHAEARHLSTL